MSNWRVTFHSWLCIGAEVPFVYMHIGCKIQQIVKVVGSVWIRKPVLKARIPFISLSPKAFSPKASGRQYTTWLGLRL